MKEIELRFWLEPATRQGKEAGKNREGKGEKWGGVWAENERKKAREGESKEEEEIGKGNHELKSRSRVSSAFVV